MIQCHALLVPHRRHLCYREFQEFLLEVHIILSLCSTEVFTSGRLVKYAVIIFYRIFSIRQLILVYTDVKAYFAMLRCCILSLSIWIWEKMFVWYMNFCTAFTNEQLLNANVNMSFL